MPTLDELAKAGIAAISEKKYDEAIAKFTDALALDASRPDLTNALGMAYLHKGEPGSALPYLERAAQLAEPFDLPEHQDMKRHFHLALASTYELMDRIPESLRVLEAACKRWPTSLEPKLQLGQLQLSSCKLDDGVSTYLQVAEHPALDKEGKAAAKAVVDAINAFRESDNDAGTFLRAHAESYRQWFDDAVKDSVALGWYAEAARMARAPDGEVKPLIPEGARPYAMQRVDLVNPMDGSVASVYSEADPMIVTLNGLEPLAQLAILFEWKGQPFETWVCSRSPWHWLPFVVQFAESAPSEKLIDSLDAVVGDWYLAGFNGDFGDKDTGRFHYVTDPESMGRAVAYTVDLGRARFEAIDALLKRLAVLHERRPIRRVVFGQGHLPD